MWSLIKSVRDYWKSAANATLEACHMRRKVVQIGATGDILSNKKRQAAITTCQSWCYKNAPGRTRTCNLRIRSPRLYPIELRAQKSVSSWNLTIFRTVCQLFRGAIWQIPLKSIILVSVCSIVNQNIFQHGFRWDNVFNCGWKTAWGYYLRR